VSEKKLPLPLPKKTKKSVKKKSLPPLPLPLEPLSTEVSVTSPFDPEAKYHLVAIGDAQQVLQLHASSMDELETKARNELKPLLSCSPLVLYVFEGTRLRVTRNTLQVATADESKVISLIDPEQDVVDVPEDGVVIGSVHQDHSNELEQLAEATAEDMLNTADAKVGDPDWDT